MRDGCIAYPGDDYDKEWCEYSQYLEMCKGCPRCNGRIKSKYQEEKDGKEPTDTKR